MTGLIATSESVDFESIFDMVLARSNYRMS